jgi:DNA-directed RNA polymerase specialized sigma24 family protein
MVIKDLKTESSEDLLVYIQWKDEPECAETAMEAFRVFTFRFQLDLMKKLITTCRNWGYDDQVASEIAYKTFEKIWLYPTYDKSKSKQTDFDKGVVIYLYIIASHLLADYKKLEDGDINPFTGDEEIIYEYPDIDNLNQTKERKAILQSRYDHIKNALDRLTPKHKIIYLTYKQYESEIKDGYKLPRKLLKKLREELDLTQNTVRVYKNEAFNAVEIYLNTYVSK